MWHAGSTGTKKQENFSPAFKNFNPYDILEPEKVKTKNDISTAVLVDIGSDDAKNEVHQNLNGSFLDKVKKSEYNLVDLYENIFVSPQHLIENNNDRMDLDLDFFKKFDVPNSNGNEKKEPTKVKGFDEIFDRVVSLKYPDVEHSKPETISEDLIDEFLLTKPRLNCFKNVERRLENIPENSCNKQKTTCPNLDEKVGNLHLEEKFKLKEYQRIKITESIKPCTSHNIIGVDKTPAFKIPPALEIRSPVQKPHSSFDNCDIFKNVTPKLMLHCEKSVPQNPFQIDSVTRYRNDIKSSLVDENKSPIIRTPQTVPIPLLQTVKKDNKAFSKRRIVKKDSEKIGFTKGPDIYEKSIVLPQMMNRLGERKKALDERKNIKKKLLLDKCNPVQKFTNTTSLNENNEVPVLSPKVLMEDCNGVRLRELRKGIAFDKFVKSGSLF